MSKVKVMVCKLNNVKFEVADKELDKYIQGFKEISYKQIRDINEIAQYSDGKKIFEVVTHWNKKDDLYSLSIYEEMDTKEVKVTMVDGDYFYTKIHGTDEEIINHYNDCNFIGGEVHKQIKEIEISLIGDETGFIGCTLRKIVYPFTWNSKAECYLY